MGGGGNIRCSALPVCFDFFASFVFLSSVITILTGFCQTIDCTLQSPRSEHRQVLRKVKAKPQALPSLWNQSVTPTSRQNNAHTVRSLLILIISFSSAQTQNRADGGRTGYSLHSSVVSSTAKVSSVSHGQAHFASQTKPAAASVSPTAGHPSASFLNKHVRLYQSLLPLPARWCCQHIVCFSIG